MIRPSSDYNANNEARYRTEMDRQFRALDSAKTSFKMQSPSGAAWNVTVDDTGALVVTAA